MRLFGVTIPIGNIVLGIGFFKKEIFEVGLGLTKTNHALDFSFYLGPIDFAIFVDWGK